LRQILHLEASSTIERYGPAVGGCHLEEHPAKAHGPRVLEHESQCLGAYALAPAVPVTYHDAEIRRSFRLVESSQVRLADEPPGRADLDGERDPPVQPRWRHGAQPPLGSHAVEWPRIPHGGVMDLSIRPPSHDMW